MEKSKYKVKFDTLVMNARFIESAARRYADELESYGITAEFLDEFSANVTAIARLPSDKDVLEYTNDCVLAKKKIRAELTAQLRFFGHHFREMFGRESVLYRTMSIRNLSSFSENKVSGIALMASARANRYSAELASRGVTAEAIAGFEDCIGRFITAMNMAEAAIDDRTAATAARITVANAVFDGCTKICHAGKKAFRNNSAARQNFMLK